MDKPNFWVRMKDHDGDDAWDEIAAWDAESAAEKYGELCAQRSGGEMLVREDDDNETVFVRDAAGAVTEWNVTVGYLTIYSANQIKAA